jgi:hypothetical protein
LIPEVIAKVRAVSRFLPSAKQSIPKKAAAEVIRKWKTNIYNCVGIDSTSTKCPIRGPDKAAT